MKNTGILGRGDSLLLVLLFAALLRAQDMPAFRAVAFSPDSQLVAAASGEPDDPGLLVVWDVTTRKPRFIHREKRGIQSFAFSNDGKVMAVGGYRDDCILLDATNGKLRGALPGHGDVARVGPFSPDGATLPVVGADKSIRLWDWANAKLKYSLSGHDDRVYQVAWSHDGKRLASPSADRTARIWNPATGELVRTITEFESLVSCVVFGPKDRWLAVGSWNLSNQVFDPSTGIMLRRFGGIHGDWLALAPNGLTMAVCGLHSRTVELFSVDFRPPTDDERRRIQALIAQLDDDASAKRDEADKALLGFGWPADPLLEKAAKDSPSAEVRLRARRLRAKIRETPLVILRGHEEAVSSAAFSPDGRYLATAGKDGLVILWDTKTWQKSFVLDGSELAGSR